MYTHSTLYPENPERESSTKFHKEMNQLLGQNNPTSCLFVNYPLTTHLTQHEQPNNVFTVPQTTQHFDPAQSTQQFVYRNNPAFFFLSVMGSIWVHPV